jgi:hypothetical protein
MYSLKFPEDPEEYILSSSIPEEREIAFPWFLKSLRNENQ